MIGAGPQRPRSVPAVADIFSNALGCRDVGSRLVIDLFALRLLLPRLTAGWNAGTRGLAYLVRKRIGSASTDRPATAPVYA